MFSRNQIIALVAVVGAVCLGLRFREERPNEKNRFHHPQGYSVCLPEGWTAELNIAHGDGQLGNAQRADGMSLSPDNFNGFPPRLEINRFSGAPDPQVLIADGWTQGTFQGQPAFVREKTLPHALSRTAMFERAGTWFEVAEGLTISGSAQKDLWWRFLESFGFTGTPATAPVLIPAASAPASTAPFVVPAMGQ